MPNGKPNILVIWGDDIGYWNISANNKGMMGYSTPNIDRIANEGIGFTDFYGQQSCTAGRSAFITGQNPLRTGLTKVGFPGAKEGLSGEDPTIAELLKPHGYATAQFGKNHLGDRDEHLPTNHGFDEFFGNLYHLNAEEEPEHEDYPKDPEFRKRFGPRGVIHSWAMPDGTQKIEDTGPLTKKRMETIDDEVTARTLEYLEEAAAGDKPFFVWWNATRMHFRTHIKDESRGLSGQGDYNDAMVEHDNHVGMILDKLDELGIADDTIVMYSTDNGPHYNTWPDGAITPFASEKNSNWEGAYRVPCFVRWPGTWQAGVTLNGIVALQDMLPTFLAAAGDPDIVAEVPGGPRGRRQDLQGLARRQGHERLLRGRCGREPAQRVLLRQRRRRTRGAARRRLEVRLQGAARKDAGAVGRALRRPAHPAHLQSPARPVRAGARELQHLLGLDDRPRLHGGAGPGRRRQGGAGPHGVPAAPEAGELQPGQGARAAAVPRTGPPSRRRAADPEGCPRVGAPLPWRREPSACSTAGTKAPPSPRSSSSSARVTTPGDSFVPPAERIATFDNDGTLWCEKPNYVQADFFLRRLNQMAEEDPSWRTRQPWKALYERDHKWLAKLMTHIPELTAGVTEAFEGITTEAFEVKVREFFDTTTHPTLGVPYTQLAYRPMLELLDLLRANDFHVYICTGGGRDFVRVISEEMYGIARDHVIGSASTIEYRDGDIYRTKGLELPIDDGAGKPVHIWRRTGRKPLFACGNADGDTEMLDDRRVLAAHRPRRRRARVRLPRRRREGAARGTDARVDGREHEATTSRRCSEADVQPADVRAPAPSTRT